VETAAGRIATEVVINAAGVYAPRICGLAGFEAPIRPRRGQILVTAPSLVKIHRCMISARYIAVKYDPDLARGDGEGVSVEQTEAGNLILGSTREFAGFDRGTTVEGMARIAARTAALLPFLAGLDVIRSFAGLRPYTPDGLPLLGPVKGLKGFYMAAGHEGDGIALSPVTGALIARMVTGEDPGFPMDAFAPDRFGGEGRA
jgi:sarcosine oxidase subunit beta